MQTQERRLVQLMHPADNVATALIELTPGTVVRVSRPLPPSTHAAQLTQDEGVEDVVVRGTIPFGHKVALRRIAAGEPVLKYGEAIGLAGVEIAPGAHVHIHNLESQRGRGDLQR